jgi:hypothetical protein
MCEKFRILRRARDLEEFVETITNLRRKMECGGLPGRFSSDRGYRYRPHSKASCDAWLPLLHFNLNHNI